MIRSSVVIPAAFRLNLSQWTQAGLGWRLVQFSVWWDGSEKETGQTGACLTTSTVTAIILVSWIH